MNFLITPRLVRSNLIRNAYRYSSEAVQTTEQNDTVLIDNTEEISAREAEIEKKRNISRLTTAHRNLVNGQRPYETPRHLSHLTVKYNRKIYGTYGIKSGINPSLCWPSRQDIQEKLDYESVAHPYTIPEMMANAAQKRLEAEERIEKREKELDAKFVKLHLWKKDLNDRIAKKTAEIEAAKIKKERLVEEVRRHFGFKLDPRDERFQEMLVKREKEQKKLEKQAKKEAKEKMMIAKLQQKSVEINDTSKSS